jgi:parvulin-like peptidyl-prolyl isomerase
VKDNIGLEVWMKRKLENISVSDKEAKDFYNENKAQMTRPEQVKASHILLKDEAKAKEVIAELKKVSSSDLKSKFQEAARKYSTGPSASKGGDLGIFGKGQMVKPFSDAAFGLGDNKMTLKPIKTQFGWHIIYVEKNIKGGTVSFADVKPQMIEGAKRKKFKNLIDLKVKALKKKAKIIYSK